MPSAPLLQKIREAAEKAESYRLHGAHDQAKHLRAELDHLLRRAEQQGLEEQATAAEFDGKEAARQQGKAPRSNPTARNPDSKLNRLFNLSRAQALTPSPQHPDFKTLEGQIKRAESDARKHGINPLLIEQAVEEGFMSGKTVAETRQNPRPLPARGRSTRTGPTRRNADHIPTLEERLAAPGVSPQLRSLVSQGMKAVAILKGSGLSESEREGLEDEVVRIYKEVRDLQGRAFGDIIDYRRAHEGEDAPLDHPAQQEYRASHVALAEMVIPRPPRSNQTRHADALLAEIQEISRKIGASGDRHGVTPQTQHLWKAMAKAERSATKQGIADSLVEQVRDAGMLEGQTGRPRSNPTRRAASSNNAALRDQAKARKFWEGVPSHMRAEVAEAVAEGFDWMDYPDVFEAPPSRAFLAELGRIVSVWEEMGGIHSRENGGARRNPSGHRCPQCREPAKVNLEDDFGECDNCEDDHGNSLRWSLQSHRTPRRIADERDEHLALAMREANDARGNGSPRRNGSPQIAVDLLNPHEEQRIRQQITARKGTPLAGTPFKIGQKVLFGGVPWHVYDHDAVGRTSKLVLVSPQGTIARHVDLGKVKPAPATRRNGPPLSRMQTIKAKYQELLAKFGPGKKLTYTLVAGRMCLYVRGAVDSATIHVDESMLKELHREALIYQEGDYWLVNAPAVPRTNGSRGRRNPPPPPPAHGTRDQVVNVHFKPRNTAELRRFETALKSAVGSARVGIVEGSDFNPVTGSACIHLRGLSAQRLEAAVKPLVKSVSPRAVLTAARRNGEGCAACAATPAAPPSASPATVVRANAARRRRNPESAKEPSRPVVMCKSDWPEGDGDFVVFEVRVGETDAAAIARARLAYDKPTAKFYISDRPAAPRSNLSRHRRNGEDKDFEEGSRFINIPPEVADLGQGWWSGQGDPLYAVLSRYYAGRYVWDVSGTRTLLEASPDEIQRLHDMAQETDAAYGKPGYDISDDELFAAQSVLDGALEDIGEGPEA